MILYSLRAIKKRSNKAKMSTLQHNWTNYI